MYIIISCSGAFERLQGILVSTFCKVTYIRDEPIIHMYFVTCINRNSPQRCVGIMSPDKKFLVIKTISFLQVDVQV